MYPITRKNWACLQSVRKFKLRVGRWKQKLYEECIELNDVGSTRPFSFSSGKVELERLKKVLKGSSTGFIRCCAADCQTFQFFFQNPDWVMHQICNLLWASQASFSIIAVYLLTQQQFITPRKNSKDLFRFGLVLHGSCSTKNCKNYWKVCWKSEYFRFLRLF